MKQQLDAGDRELVLTRESARGSGGTARAAESTASASADWRAALRAVDAALDDPGPSVVQTAQRAQIADAGTPAPPARPADPTRDAWHSAMALEQIPSGIAMGSASHELFDARRQGFASIAEIERAVASCTCCGLYRGARNPVPGEGNHNADLMCVGEAPGATEDELGRPFVGQAGQLLTKILAAIGLERHDVYICNVLKHRPPGNRNPLPDEVTACKPYLVAQVELIRPKVIVALGTFAAQTLLDSKLSISKLRGAIHQYYGVPLIVTYHPAALLRNPSWKRPTWEDVQLARRLIDSSAGSVRRRS
ncbi:MAG: uracil-DNA glycosylase [Gemmatimonadaceae bacterium]